MPTIDLTPAAVRTRSPRSAVRRLAVDLYQALAYRRRDVPHRAGLGAIRIRSHVVTGRWEPLWRFADDTIWLVFPVQMLGRLESCTTRSQVEQLMRDGAR